LTCCGKSMGDNPRNSSSYQVEVLQGSESLDSDDDNVDVRVRLADGRIYFATFFTLSCIRRLMASYRDTGECDGGKYFWSSNMIVVAVLTRATIAGVVEDLMGEGDFFSAFALVSSRPEKETVDGSGAEGIDRPGERPNSA